MKNHDTSAILNKPIQKLNVSKEFKVMAKANRFRTLQDVLHCSVYDLPKKKQSGYRMLREFLNILDEYELMDLLEEQ